MRVKIKKIPNAAYGGQQPGGALDVTSSAWSSAESKGGTENLKVKKTLTAVPRDKANLEAEDGETAFGPISGDTIPDHFNISGSRHSSGGVPLNLPTDTFIFSDTKAMKIRDPKILKMFGKTRKKGGYTPAELAKPYDINKYKAILMDKDSDRKDRENAELMIKNYIMKLGALAIAQESRKGFPQGIPEMAKPYMEANGISEEDLMPEQQPQEGQMPQEGQEQMAHGGFHSPFEQMMEKRKENDFTNLSKSEDLLTGPQGQYTKDETLANIYGDEPGLRMGTDGKLYENEKKETGPDREISFEQKINQAWDIDGDQLADQGAWFAGAVTNIGEGVKTAKRKKSMYDKGFDRDAREDAFYGEHYVNTPGVVAPSGVSPTSVQNYRSQFGGALDRFVYGGYDEPITPVADDPNYANIDYSSLNPEQSAIAQSKEFRMDPRAFRGQVPFGVRRQQRKANKDLMSKGQGIYGVDLIHDPNYVPFDFDKQRKRQRRQGSDNDGYSGNMSGPGTGTRRPMQDDHNFTKVGKFAHNIAPWNWSEDRQVRSNPTKFWNLTSPRVDRPSREYGGTPMAMYGTEMGGAYFPIMSSGGASRVKITGLPKRHTGGDSKHFALPHHKSTLDKAEVISKKDFEGKGDEWVLVTDKDGRTYKVLYKDGVMQKGTKQDYVVGDEQFKGGDQAWLDGEACSKIAASNMTVADFIKNHPKQLWDYSNAKYNAYLAKCENLLKDTEAIDKAVRTDQECLCNSYDENGNVIKNADGTPKTYRTKIVIDENGDESCPCTHEVTTEQGEMLWDDPVEPARWSDRAIGNLITQTRYRTDAERLDPFLLDEPEYSPALQRRYDQDIQSNLAGMRSSIDTSGGTAQQKLFANLAGVEKGLTEVGKRQKQTEDYNVNVLNQAAQIAANLQMGTGARNQQSWNQARQYNAMAGDKETSARNAKMQAINLAKTDAQNEMLQKATWNFNNPEFQIGYEEGLPWKRRVYKDPNATKGQKDLTAEYMRILGHLGVDDANNKQVAYNLAVKSVYGNVKTKQYGGHVSGSNMYPFFND